MIKPQQKREIKKTREISLIKPSFGLNQFKVNFTLIHELFNSIIYIFAHKTAEKMRNKENDNDDENSNSNNSKSPSETQKWVICKQMNLFIILTGT